MIVSDTPIEKVSSGLYVKREDLCILDGPPFSKMRGVVPHLQKMKQRGFRRVYYVETSISMAGWGLAWACSQLGLECVIFDPQYKSTPALLKYHRRQWAKLGALTIPQPAGRAKVNWYSARKVVRERGDSEESLLALGIPFEESIRGTCREAQKTPKGFGTVVSCVGSGTIFSGLVRGFYDQPLTLIGVMVRGGSIPHKLKTIEHKSKCLLGEGFYGPTINIQLINPGWDYTDICHNRAPFPCHPYYDRKAWVWLMENGHHLEKPILFWNIGSIARQKETEDKRIIG